jgi:predicted RNA-binding Zn ribbon-like protein
MATHASGAPFKLVGGRACLDFVNTVSGRLPNPDAPGRDYADRVEQEWLLTFDDLVRWGTVAGGLSPAEAQGMERAARAMPARAARVLARARGLREALYRLFVAVAQRRRPDPADIEVLNRELARARTRERLAPGSRRFELTWVADSHALDRVLWPVARSAADLLQSDELGRVRRCDGGDCRWLFVDTSRSRNRRWCDMADCGNTAKVRRYRRRR